MQYAILKNVTVRAAERLDLVGCTTASTNRDALLASLGRWLTEHGYAERDYAPALLAREAQFPTGLETVDGGVALPHADSELVTHPALVLCRPDQPVAFRRMDQPNHLVDARLILLLALQSGSEHLDLLRRVATLLSDERLRAPLLATSDPLEDTLTALSSALRVPTTTAPSVWSQ